MQYKDKEIRLKSLPPTPPRMEGSDMHRLIKRRITSSRRVFIVTNYHELAINQGSSDIGSDINGFNKDKL